MPYGSIAADKITTSDGFTLGGSGATMKNRIINGAMVIDQRNAGANTTVSSSRNHYIDRFSVFAQAGSKLSIQQNAGSVTPPVGFTNYAGLVCTSAVTLGSGDQYMFEQQIEGYNIADLGFGATGAQTVTLSFWVRSSLTGTFAGVISNSAENRTYPFTYAINSENTWEYKTVTIPGDTSGTWLTTNGVGLRLKLNLGTGTTYRGTAGAWTSTSYISSVTSTVNFVETVAATFYITGVQLEVGSQATSFDYRPYGTELQLCQRYYEKSFAIGTAPAEGSSTYATGGCAYANGGLYVPSVQFKVQKRTAPSITLYRSAQNATDGAWGVYDGNSWSSGTSGVVYALEQSFTVNISTNVTADNGYAILGSWVASAEL